MGRNSPSALKKKERTLKYWDYIQIVRVITRILDRTVGRLCREYAKRLIDCHLLGLKRMQQQTTIYRPCGARALRGRKGRKSYFLHGFPCRLRSSAAGNLQAARERVLYWRTQCNKVFSIQCLVYSTITPKPLFFLTHQNKININMQESCLSYHIYAAVFAMIGAAALVGVVFCGATHHLFTVALCVAAVWLTTREAKKSKPKKQ